MSSGSSLSALRSSATSVVLVLVVVEDGVASALGGLGLVVSPGSLALDQGCGGDVDVLHLRWRLGLI